MRKKTILIFIAALLTNSITHAMNHGGQVTFTLETGYYFFDDKRHVQNAWLPLFGVGYNFTNEWGIEALYGFYRTHFKNAIPDDRQIRGSLLVVDGLYHFCPAYSWQPFVFAGVGILGMNPNGNSANNEGNVNFGLGMQWFADKTAAFRIEARDIYTFIGGKNDYILDAGVTFFLDIC